jgi:hypothetical protein
MDDQLSQGDSKIEEFIASGTCAGVDVCQAEWRTAC